MLECMETKTCGRIWFIGEVLEKDNCDKGTYIGEQEASQSSERQTSDWDGFIADVHLNFTDKLETLWVPLPARGVLSLVL
jgi:hypothetical protein